MSEATPMDPKLGDMPKLDQGASGVGIGNFQEVGPLDTFLKPRNSTWLKKTELLFVDSPVGAGYSFVEDKNLYVKSDEEAALSSLLLNLMVAKSRLAEKIRKQLTNGEYVEATETWMELESMISVNSNSVDFYNFLLDSGMDPLSLTTSEETRKENRLLKKSSADDEGNLDKLMNGIIKRKLKIIPKDLSWGNNSGDVFTAMQADFMRPTIERVDELLAKGVDVTIYNGQLDVICSTSGTEAWVHNHKWEGIQEFKKMDIEPLYCENDRERTRGFTKSFKNLHFYWILGAGHFQHVPVDEPCVALKMVGEIMKSPQL
ncbi:unnamed protein product [Eruca vesicaria subsp. sativa]|uniref:Uncharacterized protein n=1 Tax=Eruca vesicaria subsp. sativa TaxID=29727 RepID=A0ABC8IWF9_ERUVS|nr:unnamed protein product [Eruca vesicaria subsp. sativa]